MKSAESHLKNYLSCHAKRSLKVQTVPIYTFREHYLWNLQCQFLKSWCHTKRRMCAHASFGTAPTHATNDLL